jgi:hypothetical protein
MIYLIYHFGIHNSRSHHHLVGTALDSETASDLAAQFAELYHNHYGIELPTFSDPLASSLYDGEFINIVESETDCLLVV